MKSRRRGKERTHDISSPTRPRGGARLGAFPVDYGCFAPVAVFIDVFAAQGGRLPAARAPMGLYKRRDHIQAIAAMPSVAGRWQAVHERPPADSDIDAMFAAAVPLQLEAIRRRADLIPGALAAIAAFRARGLKIGTCTGYTRPMMAVLLPLAAAQGYEPDALVCPDEVPAARPAPWMAFTNAMRLGLYPMAAWVKIGDTPVDIAEGLNAGMWTIGLAKTGNELGLSATEVDALPAAQLETRLEPIRAKLIAAGAHYVVDSLADAPPLLDAIGCAHAGGAGPGRPLGTAPTPDGARPPRSYWPTSISPCLGGCAAPFYHPPEGRNPRAPRSPPRTGEHPPPTDPSPDRSRLL
ncbi:MAG: phosphonoacetaldehyde hydrolase [Chloroflexi bacterium]|nr:phosphonoacetaldehyde hydrolase [Chloroflexota bacterium]